MKVLCICPIGIGNYLLFYPACNLIRAMRPEISLHLLALRNAIADLGNKDSLWDKIHVIDPTRVRDPGTIISFINAVRSEHFDAGLSFFPSNKWQYNLLPYLCGVKERFAFNYPMKRISSLSFLNNRKIPVNCSLHDVHQNTSLSGLFLERDLYDQKLTFPELCSGQDIVDAKRILNTSPSVKIAVHPGSSGEHGMDIKRWAPERFGALADKICEFLGAEALVFGGPDEKELKEQTAASMKQPVRIVDPVNLRLTSAMLKECLLCLCNDSGLMHIAACSGVPVAAVFGPTDEKRNGPVGNGHLIIRKKMPGFPLWTARNAGVRTLSGGIDPQASLKALSVEDAWKMTEPWLSKIKQKVS